MTAYGSQERLRLVEEAFATLAQCVGRIRESGVAVDDDALSVALASIGSQLLSAAEFGTDQEQPLLLHWIDHAPTMSRELIKRAEASPGRTITPDVVRSIFKKAPPPEFSLRRQAR
jgi:hypothetical protein